MLLAHQLVLLAAVCSVAIVASAAHFFLSTKACSHPELIHREECGEPAFLKHFAFNPEEDNEAGLFLTLDQEGLRFSTGTLTAAVYVKANHETIFIEPYDECYIQDLEKGDMIYAATFGPNDPLLGRCLIKLHQASHKYADPQVVLEVAKAALDEALKEETQPVIPDRRKHAIRDVRLIILQITDQPHIFQKVTNIVLDAHLIATPDVHAENSLYDYIRKALMPNHDKFELKA